MSNRTRWLATSLMCLTASLCVMFRAPDLMATTALTETGVALMLGLSFVTFLHWLALGDQKRRRREHRQHNIQPR